jgi:hypothetical protein
LRVPWITPWSSESSPPPPIVLRHGRGGSGIGYADEEPHVDRRDDVLWTRAAATPGVGRPHFAGIHSLRQRQAMTRMLCMICGATTLGRPDERHLFLVHTTQGEPIVEGERTAVPPVHEDCARLAIRECPHLRRGWTAALVTYTPPWGVAGIVYDAKTLRPVPCRGDDRDSLEYVSYADDERLRWVLAAREVITLHGVEPVDVASL